MDKDRFNLKFGYHVFTMPDEIILVDINEPDPVNAAIKRLNCEVYSLREKAIKEGLIKLGWTPPPEKEE